MDEKYIRRMHARIYSQLYVTGLSASLPFAHSEIIVK